ncbi:fat storage-inducing transmembrane protein 1 [Gopherus evgoodei]|uniref:fat storage-inducing transmembrane protein 1 n=1 Tax=Gopherus evgoodei TaxID=1825980 RepID=UPI0011CFABF9|nr:fat storage-inducing transmembrane protein 1 [Gopherus evgoodei]
MWGSLAGGPNPIFMTCSLLPWHPLASWGAWDLGSPVGHPLQGWWGEGAGVPGWNVGCSPPILGRGPRTRAVWGQRGGFCLCHLLSVNKALAIPQAASLGAAPGLSCRRASLVGEAMAGSGGRLPLALLATVAGWALALARGLVFLCSEHCAWLLGAPWLRRAYHAWLAGAVVLGPLLHPLADPHAVLANQRNYFSRTFVASAWGWTCLLAGGFSLLVSYGATGRALAALRPLARLAVGSALQLAAAAAFGLLEEPTGDCYAALLPPRAERPGYLPPRAERPGWAAFLLTFCCLLLAEELAVFRRYLARGHPAGAALRLVFLLNVLLLGLWSLLLLGGAVYGPAYGPQLGGAAAGTLAWHLTYRGWYRARWSPGRPGPGLFPRGEPRA